MATDVGTYFDCLEAFIFKDYKIARADDRLTLNEKIFTKTGSVTQSVLIKFKRPTFAINLDLKKSNGQSDRLFHFLEDTARPWAKRCDFVLFQKAPRNIQVAAMEFKSGNIKGDLIKGQLQRTEHWCKSLQAIVSSYTGDKVVFQLKKYVLTDIEDLAKRSPYLGEEDKYLNVDSKIRHLTYTEVNGQFLEKLDHNRNIKIN